MFNSEYDYELEFAVRLEEAYGIGEGRGKTRDKLEVAKKIIFYGVFDR